MATAAEAADMLRVGRSAVYQLITARQRESIKIGARSAHRSPRSAPHRGPECGVLVVPRRM